eukprot:TRINITY_DN2130_c0_g2_i1.p1 TRINITY_DN2130_c0_g2~~TRINITY_DN2130_c0_g2_i1.p1  ORF type:complete len:548 (+),score=128.29 TRINITY_DN2130_c0_g2_i1:225-1868(+)
MSLVEVFIAPKKTEIDRALLIRLSDKTQTKPYSLKLIDATLRRESFLDKQVNKAKRLGTNRVNKVIKKRANVFYDNAATLMSNLENKLDRTERRHRLLLQRIKLCCHHHNILVNISNHNCFSNENSRISYLKAKMLDKQIRAKHNRNKILKSKGKSFQIWKFKRNRALEKLCDEKVKQKLKLERMYYQSGVNAVDEREQRRQFAMKHLEHVNEVVKRKKQSVLHLKRQIVNKQKMCAERRQDYLFEIANKARFHNQRVKYTLQYEKEKNTHKMLKHFEKMDLIERNYLNQLSTRTSFARRSSLRLNIIRRLNELKNQCLFLKIMRKEAEASRRRENYLLAKCLFAKKDVRLVNYRRVLEYHNKLDQKERLRKKMEKAEVRRNQFLANSLIFSRLRNDRERRLHLKIQEFNDLLRAKIACDIGNATQRRREELLKKSLFAKRDVKNVEENKKKLYLRKLRKISKIHSKLVKASKEHEITLLTTSEKARRMALRSAPGSPEETNIKLHEEHTIGLLKINEKLQAATKRRENYLRSRITHSRTLSSPSRI